MKAFYILLVLAAGALAIGAGFGITAYIQKTPSPAPVATSSFNVLDPATPQPAASSTKPSTTSVATSTKPSPPTATPTPTPKPAPPPATTVTTVTTTVTTPTPRPVYTPPTSPPAIVQIPTVVPNYTQAPYISVAPIALLGGGTAVPGTLIPIIYMQVLNQSTSTVSIKGFWVQQNGSAPESSVVGFTSVDDKGGSRGSVGGAEGSLVFSGGKVYVPTSALLIPGERKLFTLKAKVSSGAGQYAGTTLKLDVSGIDASIPARASFPIRGTTWMIGG